MKLIFCPRCTDVIKLRKDHMRQCVCGASFGRYLSDGLNAEISPLAIPIGFDNRSLSHALHMWRTEGPGARFFSAFVISDICATITTINTPTLQEGSHEHKD